MFCSILRAVHPLLLWAIILLEHDSNVKRQLSISLKITVFNNCLSAALGGRHAVILFPHLNQIFSGIPRGRQEAFPGPVFEQILASKSIRENFPIATQR